MQIESTDKAESETPPLPSKVATSPAFIVVIVIRFSSSPFCFTIYEICKCCKLTAAPALASILSVSTEICENSDFAELSKPTSTIPFFPCFSIHSVVETRTQMNLKMNRRRNNHSIFCRPIQNCC